MPGKITHLQLSPSKAGNLPLQTCDKNSKLFLLYDMGVNFQHLANLGSFAKVSVPMGYIILCLNICYFDQGNL